MMVLEKNFVSEVSNLTKLVLTSLTELSFFSERYKKREVDLRKFATKWKT